MNGGEEGASTWGGEQAAQQAGGYIQQAGDFAARVQDAAGHAGDAAGAPVAGFADLKDHGGELDLAAAEHLPWLDAGEDAEEGELDHGRLAGFVAGALALLAALVGGVWWLTHPHGDVGAANGGTIEAPATPYKEAPKNPGGKTFDGTGDSSFAVSQGKSTTGQLAEGKADGGAPTVPGAAIAAGAAANKAGAAAAGAVAGSASGIAHAAASVAAKATGATPAEEAVAPAPAGGLAQIGAYSNRAAAEAGWTRLSGQSSLLAGQHHRIVEGQADIGTVYRLQVVTAAGGAAGLCEKLRAAGLACQVKH